MAQTRCPACGAPLPTRWGSKGIECSHCGNFLPVDLLEGSSSASIEIPKEITPQPPDFGEEMNPEPAVHEPVVSVNIPRSEPEPEPFRMDEGPIIPPQITQKAKGIGKTVIIVVIIAACLSLTCLAVIIYNVAQQFAQ